MGANSPFFCVPAAQSSKSTLFANGSIYAKLARRLGPNQPFYTFCMDYPIDRHASPLTIERIAEGFLRELRTLQPSGPYFLGGWSFGGLVAYEMARELEAQGEAVELLALIDVAGPGYPRRRPWLQQARLHCERMRGLGMTRRAAYLLNTLRELTQSNWLSFRKALGRWRGRINPIQIEDAYLARLGSYGGPLVLLVADETLSQTADKVEVVRDPQLGWSAVVKGEVTIHRLPGDHFSLLEEPGVAAIADRLATHLCKPLNPQRH